MIPPGADLFISAVDVDYLCSSHIILSTELRTRGVRDLLGPRKLERCASGWRSPASWRERGGSGEQNCFKCCFFYNINFTPNRLSENISVYQEGSLPGCLGIPLQEVEKGMSGLRSCD